MGLVSSEEEERHRDTQGEHQATAGAETELHISEARKTEDG